MKISSCLVSRPEKKGAHEEDIEQEGDKGEEMCGGERLDAVRSCNDVTLPVPHLVRCLVLRLLPGSISRDAPEEMLPFCAGAAPALLEHTLALELVTVSPRGAPVVRHFSQAEVLSVPRSDVRGAEKRCR